MGRQLPWRGLLPALLGEQHTGTDSRQQSKDYLWEHHGCSRPPQRALLWHSNSFQGRAVSLGEPTDHETAPGACCSHQHKWEGGVDKIACGVV